MTFERDRQSRATREGAIFEQVVAKILNTFLASDGIVVARAKEPTLRTLIQNEVNMKNLLDYTRVPVKRRCDQKQPDVYPDLDLFALLRPIQNNINWRLLAIISCKVSFHARETESTFWGLLVRLSSNIPFVLVTEDRTVYTNRRSELGASCTNPSKARMLLESFTDGIYLAKQYPRLDDAALQQDIETKQSRLIARDEAPAFDDPAVSGHTRYCHSVRPLDKLIEDLRRWKAEVP